MSTTFDLNNGRVYKILLSHKQISDFLSTVEFEDIADLKWLEDILHKAQELSE